MGELQARPQVTAPSRIYFAGEHLIEKVSIARFLLGGLFEQPFQASLDRFQSQAGQCVLQPLDWRHCAPPMARLSYTASERDSTAGAISRMCTRIFPPLRPVPSGMP